MTTTDNPMLDFDLLESQLAALERCNDSDGGEDQEPRRDGDHELLLGLENMLSEMLRDHRDNRANMSTRERLQQHE